MIAAAQRDQEGENDAGERGVYAGLEQCRPHDRADQEIGRLLDHAAPVQQRERREARARDAEREQREVLGVEERDDHDRADVVEDRDGHQERAQRERDAIPQQHQNGEREGDVGGGGNRPALQRHRVLPVDPDVDRRRHEHAADRAERRQAGLTQIAQITVDELALELQADQQEEHRHEPVVDPQEQRLVDPELTDPHLHGQRDQRAVEGARGRVGDEQRQRRRSDQQDSARRLVAQEIAKRVDHGGRVLRSGLRCGRQARAR